MTTTASQPSASAAGEANALAPASTSGLALIASRFHTPTSCPTAINRCAIAAPILPVPQMPTFIFLSSGSDGVSSLVGMIHAEMLCDQLFGDLGRIARKDAASGVENDGLVGHFQRQFPVLFDQNDGLAFFLEPFDRAADFSDDQRRQPLRRLVE